MSVRELVRLAQMVDDFAELREAAARVAEAEPVIPSYQEPRLTMVALKQTVQMLEAACKEHRWTSAERYAGLAEGLARELRGRVIAK